MVTTVDPQEGTTDTSTVVSSFMRRGLLGLSNDNNNNEEEEGRKDDDTVDSVDEEDTSGNDEGTIESTRKLSWIRLFLLVIMVMGIAVGLGVGLGLKHGHGKPYSSSSSSHQATLDATPAPVSAFHHDGCFPDFDPDVYSPTVVEFPCLLGLTGDQASARLEEAYPGMLDIVVLPEDSPVTMDLRFNRVRIFVSHGSGLVVQVPQVG
jgi:hypothetical protein